MTERHNNTEPVTDEQLVAYLDGELDVAVARQIEASLADDPRLHGRLRDLDRTWGLLGQLETDAVSHDFTRSTLELVAAAGEADRKRAVNPWRRALRLALLVIGLAVSGAAGFFIVTVVRPDPNRGLLEDLPVLENLDYYRAAQSLEFLGLLYRSDAFSEDPPADDEPDSRWIRFEPPEVARRRIEGMSPAEKERLRARREQFAALDAAEQTHLRRLHEDLAADPEAEALWAVAERYFEWLKPLPPFVRAELLALPPVERVERVERLRRRGPQLSRHRWPGRSPRGHPFGPEERQLAEFFEKELSDAEFDRLLALPAEEWQRELQQLYRQRRQGAPAPPGFRRPGAPR